MTNEERAELDQLLRMLCDAQGTVSRFAMKGLDTFKPIAERNGMRNEIIEFVERLTRCNS